MDLKHFSKEPMAFDPDWHYGQGGHYKPYGFWVSDEEEFGCKSYLSSEGYTDPLDPNWGYEHSYDVEISPDAKILWVRSYEEIHALDRKIKKWPQPPDWSPIIDSYDGVVITPYSRLARMDFLWYSSWDCASGVFWNLRSLKDIQSEIKKGAGLRED